MNETLFWWPGYKALHLQWKKQIDLKAWAGQKVLTDKLTLSVLLFSMQTHTSAEWEYKLKCLYLLSKLKHLLMMKDGERWDHLNTDAGEGVRAICNRMSLSISRVMKKDWEGLHGPTATGDRAIAMHQVLHLRLNKLRPAAREVRLQKDERSTRLNVSPLAPYPLNDMAHSYKQLAFKDTSRSCERKYTNMDGSLIKTSGGINKKKRKKNAGCLNMTFN